MGEITKLPSRNLQSGHRMASSEDIRLGAASDREAAERAAAQWIARRGTPEWAAADAEAFDTWLAESASHRAAYYRLNAAWEEAGRLAAFTRRSESSVAGSGPEASVAGTELDVTSARAQARARAPRAPAALPRVGGTYTRVAVALAASILIVVIAGSLWLYRETLFHSNRYSTVVGAITAVPLADGSRVTLNTDSALRVDLRATERDVDLDRGEAFFEVAKDPQRPFVVNAGVKRVIAVGTQFSVYREGDEVRVTVAEGTVRLEDRATGGEVARTARNTAASSSDAAGSAEVVLLTAGTVARAQKDAVLVREQGSTEIEQQLSWRSGLLTFRDTVLSDAVAEFNRYNERKIVIADPSIATLQLGGVFRSTNIDPFIALLEEGFPVHARDEGNRIVLTHN